MHLSHSSEDNQFMSVENPGEVFVKKNGHSVYTFHLSSIFKLGLPAEHIRSNVVDHC